MIKLNIIKKKLNNRCLVLLSFFFFTTLFYSCVSTKSVTYFKGNEKIDTANYSTLVPLVAPIPTIQQDDILAIVVSSLSEESNSLFNVPNTSTVNTTVYPGSSSQGQQPLGYTVDGAGYVSLPLVGKIKLVGLSIREADVQVAEKLNKYLKDPSVSIRALNHKATILGEVNRPGVVNLVNNQTTLLELIGMGGDLTIYGRRDNVMLIRTTDQKREVIRLDLNSRSVLNSPYYFAQNNDVLYVEPRSGKITQSDRTIQVLPIFISVATALLFLVNILK